MGEASTPGEAPSPRYRHFLVRYPGTVFDSYYLIGGGGTLRAVQIEHPLAAVEADEDSKVHVEATP